MLRPKRFKIARRLGPVVFDQTQTERFAMSEARKKNAMKKDKHKKNKKSGGTSSHDHSY